MPTVDAATRCPFRGGDQHLFWIAAAQGAGTAKWLVIDDRDRPAGALRQPIATTLAAVPVPITIRSWVLSFIAVSLVLSARRAPFLDAVVAQVRDEHGAIVSNSHRERMVELPGSRSLAAEAREKCAIQ